MNVAIIGGGAAGFFSAIQAKTNHPHARVVLFEKSKNVLSKVRISGGGRCNVTTGCLSIPDLCKAYPRGGNRLKKAFGVFGPAETMAWFRSRDVALIVEEDLRVFPASQTSQTIIDCLTREAGRLGVEIELQAAVHRINRESDRLGLRFSTNGRTSEPFDKVIVATGGSPRRNGLDWLEELGHTIEPPVPSLFTFNMPGDAITQLMGVVASPVQVVIQGTKYRTRGSLLITHWGVSGPAILKLSAFAARLLSELDYRFTARVNWIDETNHDVVAERLQTLARSHGKKQISTINPFSIPRQLWQFLIEKIDLSPQRRWEEMGKKHMNKVVERLTGDDYQVQGKTTFKEEFVTCGGVSLDSVDLRSMQSKVCKNLYFAGEVLDVDGVTGGYNFQAAWTTGFIAGQLRS